MILFVSSRDFVGQRFNGHYVQKELNKIGVQASQLVWEKES